MTEKLDYNALLLRILAHDILSPLTAIKWQTELLEKNFKKRDKREKYIKGIENSTTLGITITRHSHVAAKVLSGSYEGVVEKANLPTVVKDSVADLQLQYERHGISLNIDIDEKNEHVLEMDIALLQLFVWSVAKFFMTCVPPQTTVLTSGKKDANDNIFIFSVLADGVVDVKSCSEIFSSESSADAYDQKYVFAKLINEIAPKLGVVTKIKNNENTLTFEATFKL